MDHSSHQLYENGAALAEQLIETTALSNSAQQALKAMSQPTSNWSLALAVIDYVFRFPSHDKDMRGENFEILEYKRDYINLVEKALTSIDEGRLGEDAIPWSKDVKDNCLAKALVPYIERLYQNLFSIFLQRQNDLERVNYYSPKSLSKAGEKLVSSFNKIYKKRFNHESVKPVLAAFAESPEFNFSRREREQLQVFLNASRFAKSPRMRDRFWKQALNCARALKLFFTEDLEARHFAVKTLDELRQDHVLSKDYQTSSR